MTHHFVALELRFVLLDDLGVEFDPLSDLARCGRLVPTSLVFEDWTQRALRTVSHRFIIE